MQKINDKTQNSASASAENQNDNTTRVAYISQKTQRLASALYAITRPFPQDEPLRRTLRSQALSLVSSAHVVSEGTPADDTVIELPALLNRLCSQLAVARDGGLISAMNFSVLQEEISAFISEVNELGAYPGPHLSDTYFNSDLPTLEAARSSGRNNNRSESSLMSRPATAGNTDTSREEKQEDKRLSAKDKRRQKILDLFDEQEEITVNDVTDVINGYSTKTIQRDLKALVKNGQLHKHGKRRWTSYTRSH